MNEYIQMNAVVTALALSLLTILTIGCDRPVIEGTVENVSGEPLPGVVVKVEGTNAEDLTDAYGNYRVNFRPGDIVLQFHKTGYTPGELNLSIDKPRLIMATAVQLWRLPHVAGVYLSDGRHYEPLRRGTPERFFLTDGDMAYAVKRPPELELDDSRPLIVCYKTPRYDARLTRLQKTDAKLGPGETSTFPVWRAAGSVAVDLVPIDEVENLLLELRLIEPLDPGVYAVHWGALEGYTTLEERVFTFRIKEPPRLEEAEPADEKPVDAEPPEDSQPDTDENGT